MINWTGEKSGKNRILLLTAFIPAIWHQNSNVCRSPGLLERFSEKDMLTVPVCLMSDAQRPFEGEGSFRRISFNCQETVAFLIFI